MTDVGSSEKLQKVLARAGLGSRRELETWIADGRVRVNGAPARLGARVSPRDVIQVDGRRIARRAFDAPRLRVLRYHKPEGEICSRRSDARHTSVFERLPRLKHGRWISVGRLDVASSGLLLFTNEGELAHRLMHPSRELEREYAVRLRGEVSREMRTRLLRGVELDDGSARFERVDDAGGEGANHWYHVVVREGRNREVRRLWESQGLQVSRLIRVRYGPVRLPRYLSRGRWEELGPRGVAALARAAGLEAS